MATSENWRDKNSGERREKTEWHRVVIFSGVVPYCRAISEKRLEVYLEGQLQTHKWQDDGGNDRYTTEVVLQNYGGTMTMLDTRNSGGDFQAAGNDSAPIEAVGGSGGEINDDIRLGLNANKTIP